ncbi:methyltransferase domain-containing protein [Salinactinospora qingdaonensis]|uniref:Protein-L-isoaspartate O-methyltransferase n=1 Tax=Salinactinospora qingdaonensis TaxID=702744 RepID=A0ABP7FEC2_9ACTN
MDQVNDTDVAARIAALADDLHARGILHDQRWRHMLRAVPRHHFAPTTGWASPDDGATPHGIDADTDPSGWWDAVYSDTSIVFQTDDGTADPTAGTGEFSSSVSAPGVVTRFLELLDLDDHHRALDIGTGSGWTAGLLSARLGAHNVTSVEVDERIAAQAAANLERAGYAPTLVVGDGANGRPDGAPYDRVHVTCGVEYVPAAWITQTRPGGVIVAPWMSGGSVGHRLRLTVVDETTAVGSFHGPAAYMMLRAQRHNRVWEAHHSEQARYSTTRLDPRAVAGAGSGAHLAVAALAPRIGWFSDIGDDGGFSLLLYELSSREDSWAGCYYQPGNTDYEVVQYGDRHLWDEVEAAYLSWVRLGRPGHDRFGLTVTTDGRQRLWVDHPERTVTLG